MRHEGLAQNMIESTKNIFYVFDKHTEQKEMRNNKIRLKLVHCLLNCSSKFIAIRTIYITKH